MNKAVYKRLFTTYGKLPWQWVGWVLEIVSTLLVRVWAVVIMAQATASVAAGHIETAKSEVIVFAIGYSIGFICRTISSLIVMYTGNNQYFIESKGYYRKLTGKDMSFYRDHQTGYVVSMFRQYLDTMIVFSRFLINELTPTIISLTVPVFVLYTTNWKIGLIAAGVIVVQLIYIVWSSSKATKARLASHEAYRKMTGEVTDAITNIVAYKASGAESNALKRVARYAYDETYAYWIRHKTIVLYDLPRSLITTVGVSLAFYIAVSSSTSSPTAVGAMVLTLTYMFQILRNVMELPNLLVKHDDYVSKIYPTLHYLSNEYEGIRDPGNPKKVSEGPVGISISDMSFVYVSHSTNIGVPVFSHFSLQVEPGEQVGVVGLSGAGKSTLAGLLMRFDDINEGSIKIGDVDIREVSQNDLHKQIAYVPQEPLLFHRTIRENIAYFMSDVSDKEVVRAAKAAHAHEFITKLPNGYDTVVGERGVKLSGGQKQRVAIARAILKDSPIILFDEATSALDSESEGIIRQALPEILGKRTALIIAHRLSTIASLDRIIVLEDGKIIEEGTHVELLKKSGRYNKLWEKQTRKEK